MGIKSVTMYIRESDKKNGGEKGDDVPEKRSVGPRLNVPRLCVSLGDCVCPRCSVGVALDTGQCHMDAGWSSNTSCSKQPSTRTAS